MNPESQEPSLDFDVFISYSRKDIVFARALEKALENYTPPKDLPVPHRHLKVFRDEEDFTGVEYNQALREHLENSSKMLVICSPHARASTYVCDEIRLFAEKRGAGNIIPVLLSGIPNNEARQPEHEKEKAFPRCLREILGDMPLAANFLELDPARDKLYKGVFKGPWYTVLANIYGVSRSDIEQRDRKRKTRKRRIIASLVIGVITVLAGALILALISRHEAISQRNRADQARNDAEGLIEFMIFNLRDSLRPIGRLDLLDSVNQHVIEYYNSLTPENLTPNVLRRKSVALANYGYVLDAQGRIDEALKAYSTAKEISELITFQDPSNSLLIRDLVEFHNDIAGILVRKGNFPEALGSANAAKNIIERLIAQNPTNTMWLKLLAGIHNNIGTLYTQNKCFDEALEAFTAAKDIHENVVGQNPSNTSKEQLSGTYNNIGLVLLEKARLSEALEALTAGKDILDNLASQNPSNPILLDKLANCQNSIGLVLFKMNRREEALTFFTVAKDIREELTAHDPSNAMWLDYLSDSYNNIGNVLLEMNKPEEALKLFSASKDINVGLTAQDPSNVMWLRNLSSNYKNIGKVLSQKGRLKEALEAFTAGKDILEKLAAQVPSNDILLDELSSSYSNIGSLLFWGKHLDEALIAYNARKDIIEKLLFQNPSNSVWEKDLSLCQSSIGDILIEKGQYNDALDAFKAGKKIAESYVGQDPDAIEWKKILSCFLEREAKVKLAMGNKEAAAISLTSAADILAQLSERWIIAEERTQVSKTLGNLSRYLLIVQQPEKAVEAAIEGLEKDPSQIWIYANLAHGHLLNGRYSQAEKIYLEHDADILSDGRRFDQAVLDDFQELRRNGIAHPDMERIEKLLASRR